MAILQARPDNIIFAESALTGELANFVDMARGWGSTLVQTKGIPPMEWFNFIGKRSDQAVHYLLQQGIDNWNIVENYPVGALIKVIADNMVYKSVRNNIGVEPKTSSADWIPVLSISEATAAARIVGKSVGNVLTVGSLGYGSKAEVSTNANTIVSNGNYELAGTATGVPIAGVNFGLIHFEYADGGASQIAFNRAKRISYLRNRVGSKWDEWSGQYSPDNKPTAEELGINQDFIPLAGSDDVTGNITTTGAINIARRESKLFTAANAAGVGVHLVSGNVVGSLSSRSVLNSVPIGVNTYSEQAASWADTIMSSIRHQMSSNGSTKQLFHVSKPGTISDRRAVGFEIDGLNGRAGSGTGFQLFEGGVRVYSPNNPQPVDLSSVVRRVRLGAQVYVKRTAHESFVLHSPAGHVFTGINVYSRSGKEDEVNGFYTRPIQMLIDGIWITVGQV